MRRRSPTMIPVSDLRQDVAKVLRRMNASKEPFVITQRGRAAAVMVSVREYERADYERQLLLALMRGNKEVEIGEGHDLGSVLRDADALLARETD